MRRILFVALLILAASQFGSEHTSAQTTIAFVQANNAVPQTPSTSVSVTFTAAQTSGNLNVVVVGWNDSTAQVQSVIDSRGNTYQLAVGPTILAGSATQSIYYAANIAAAPANGNSVTVTFAPAATFADVRIAEYRGLATTNAVDVTAAATGNSASSDSGAVTTTNADDLIVAANVVQTTTTGPGASFTSRLITSPDGDILEDRIVTTTGSYNAVAPVSSGRWVMQMVAFRAAGGAPDTQPPTAPGTPVLTVVSSAQINLTWPAATDNIGVTGYQVERCAGAGCATFTQIAAPTTTNFSDTTLTASTSYSYRVRATDASSNLSAYSGIASATTQAGSAIAFVQTAAATPQSSPTSVAVTYTAAQAAGDLNVVVVGWNSGTGQVTSVSDTAGNTYVSAVGPTVLSGSATQVIYYAANIAAASAGGNTVTVTFSAAAPLPDIRIAEYRGLATSAPVDVVSAATGNSNSSDSGAVATTNTSALIVGANMVQTTTTGPGPSFTSRVITSPDGDILEDRIVTTTGSYSAIAPVSNGWWVMQMVAFRAAGPTDPQPPTAPGTPVLSVVSGSQVNLAWAAATDNIGVIGYLVERCAGVGCTTFAQIATTASASFNDTGLSASISYSYRVRATDGSNLGPYSAAATAITPDTQPPTAPGTPVFSGVSSSQINLTWTASTDDVGVTSYFVERCAGAGCAAFAQVGTSAIAAFSDSALSPSTTYRYRVRAIDAANNPSSYSGIGIVTTQAPPDTNAPSAPGTPVLTVVSSSQINLTWPPASDNVGVAGYIVERCAGAGCITFGQVGTSATTSFSDSGLTGSTLYTYRISASDDSGNVGPASVTASAFTLAPPAVTLVQHTSVDAGTASSSSLAFTTNTTAGNWIAAIVRAGKTGQTISVTDNRGNTYRNAVQLNETSDGMTIGIFYAENITGGATTVTVTDSISGGTLRYVILEYAGIALANSLDGSAASQGTSASPSSGPATMTAPGDLVIGVLSSANSQTFTAGSGWAIQERVPASSTKLAIEDQVRSAAGSVSATGTLSSSDSWAGVVAGFRSAAGVDTDPPTAPGTPVPTVVSGSQINLAWPAAIDNVGVTGYLIERCATPGCATFAQVGTSATTTFNDTGLLTATSYSYRVRAADTANNLGLYSNTVSAATPDTQPPTAPGTPVLTIVSSRQLTLAWPAAIDNVAVAGYTVERCAGSGCTTFAQVATLGTTSFNDTSLNPSTSYSYRVRAVDTAGNLGPYSTTATGVTQADTQPPTAPGAPLSTVVSNSQINLTWPAATDDVGVTGYLVERCVGLGCATFAPIATLSSTSFNDTGLTPSTSYSYRVRAADAAGNISPYSTTTSAVTQPDTQPPGAPGTLAPTVVSSSQINLTWPAATDDIGVTGYFIERCAGAGCAVFAQIGTSVTTSFNDTGLTAAATYRYRVRATDAAGNLGPYSNTLSATTPDTQPPTAPGVPVLTVVSTGQITLSWPAASDDVGVTSYLLERCTGVGCVTFSQIGTPATTTFNDTGLSPSTSFSYRVRAIDAANNIGPYSTTETAVTPADTQPPSAPGALVVTSVSGSQINLSWTAATDDVGVTLYHLERCASAGCTTFAQVATSATTSFSDAGLVGATSYSYRVRATDAANNPGPYSNAISATTPDTEPPTAPGLPVLAVLSTVQINLAWPAATDDVGVTGYLVERCDGAGCTTFTQVATPLTTSFNDTRLSPATSYSYRVRATDAAHNLSPYSTTVTAATPPDTLPPTAPDPVGLTVVSSSQINLTWPAATDDVGVTSYLVERCAGVACVSFAQVATPATTSFNDTGLIASTSYSYRVRATDAANNLSAYSTTATAVALPDTQPPTAPGALVLTVVSSSQISVTWSASTDDVGVTGYVVERCTGVGCTTFAPLGTPTSATLSDIGLSPATTYSYRVRATDAAGNLGPFSGVASATTPDTEPPTAPGTPVVTVVSATQISLTWPAASDDVAVTGYLIERCAGAGCVALVQIGTTPATGYDDTHLAPLTSYTYRVRATDAAHNLGAYSTTATGTTPADTLPPTAPGTPVLNVISSGQINVTWPAATDDVGVTGYMVERCTGNACDAFAQIGTPATLSLNDTLLDPVTSYSYRVRATDAAGNLGPYSATGTAATLPDTQPPTAPGKPVLTVVSSTQINLTWPVATDNVGVTSYFVERCAGLGCTTFAQIGTSTVAIFIDTGLATSTTYSYRVRASDAVNNIGPYSSIASATTPDTQPPTAPGTPVLSVVSSGQINLSWPPGADDVGVTRYLIERCGGEGCTTFGQVGATSATTYVSGGLLGSTSYSFRVRATDAAGNVSDYSPTASAITLTPDPISLVQHTSKDAGSTTSSSLAFAADTTAGNWIGVVIRAGRTGQTFTVTDTAGNTYGQAVLLNLTTDATTLAIYYAENIAGGPTAITVADSLGGTLRFAILEYAGVALANSLDGTETGQGVSDSPAVESSASVAAGDLAIGAFSTANSRTFSPGDGWALEERVPAPPTTKLSVEDGIVSTTGPIFADGNLSSSDSWGAVAAAFRAGAPVPRPDLTLVKGHAGTFIQGQAGATFTLSVLNGGTGASNGTVTVVDTLPSWLTATALSGPGWTCTLASVSCVRSEPLQAGSYYPDITVTASVSFIAPASVTNSATVSGGGEQNTANNTAVDVAAVTAAPPDTEPPSAPGALTTVAVSGVQVNLSWGPATDNVAIAGYRVERCLGAACTGFVKLATPTVTSYTDTGLIPNATYTYIVRAVDVANNLGPYSNTSIVTTLANDPSLVAAYAFDENTGSTAADRSGTGNPGAITGATWTSAGRYGSALLFSGTNGRVTVADSASLHLTTGMTLEAWVNPSTASAGAWGDIIYKGDDNYYLDTVSGAAVAGVTLTPSKKSNTTGPALPLNTWTHLAETFDGSSVRLYINGVQAAATAVPGSLMTSTNALEIGSDHLYGQSFRGMIDEVRVYNVALSPTQIQTDMATPVGSSVPVVRLSPAGLNFGQQGTGIPSSPLEAVLTNTGGTALSITSVTVTGPNASDFALTTTCESAVAPHDSCLLDVTMTASAAGGELATMVIADNAPGAPHTLSLTGTGVGFTITPRTSTITSTLAQQFNVIGGIGPFIWSVDGVEGGTAATGVITTTGLYTPPPTGSAHVVTVKTADLTKTSNATVYVTNYAGMLTHHNDNFRTGQNLSETVLTTSNVTPASFGKLFSYSLDGLAMASPLYVANVRLPDASIHNIVYVATEHDSGVRIRRGRANRGPALETELHQSRGRAERDDRARGRHGRMLRHLS